MPVSYDTSFRQAYPPFSFSHIPSTSSPKLSALVHYYNIIGRHQIPGSQRVSSLVAPRIAFLLLWTSSGITRIRADRNAGKPGRGEILSVELKLWRRGWDLGSATTNTTISGWNGYRKQAIIQKLKSHNKHNESHKQPITNVSK